MILKEFNLEEHIKSEKAYSFEEGQELERKRFSQLTQYLIDDSRIEDLQKAAKDPNYLEQLMNEYHII